MRPLWPTTRKGAPGAVAPTSWKSGVSIRTRYQTPGAFSERCGSLARIGLPLAVWPPLIAQALDALLGAQSQGRISPSRPCVGPS